LKTLAIVVNYKSATLTLQAVKSVLESRSLGPVQVAVVDNSAEAEEAEILRAELPSPVKLQINSSNKGFGFACNQVFEKFESDAVLLINPDARLLPGCLKQLQTTLHGGRNVAAVSPQIFWDDEQVYYLPPPYPTALFEYRPLLSSWGSKTWISRLISLFWRKRSIKIWQSEKPVAVSNLSGAWCFWTVWWFKKQAGYLIHGFFCILKTRIFF
jgi:GT2 family glycosyltransferase